MHFLARPLALFGALGMTSSLACARGVATAAPSTRSAQLEVAARIDALFRAFGGGDAAGLRAVVTDDFYLFEHAKWNADTLERLMPAVKGREWSLENICVTVDGAHAYVTYENYPVKTGAGWWLESAVLRRENGLWRIAFMHSTRMPARPESTVRASSSGPQLAPRCPP